MENGWRSTASRAAATWKAPGRSGIWRVAEALREDEPKTTGTSLPRWSPRLRPATSWLRFETECASQLCPRNLHSNLFRQAFTNLGRQAGMDAARAFHGGIEHGDGSGCRYGDYQPDQRGQGEARQGGNLQPESVPRTKVADHSKGQQKHAAR